jgi:hypothetical protein
MPESPIRQRFSLTERAWWALARQSDGDDCWLWEGPVDREGYGRAQVGPTLAYVHVLVYEEFVGSVPEGKELDHTCRVRHCANWCHVEPVTHQQNCARRPLPLTCRHGHDYTQTWYRDYAGKLRCCQCTGRNRHVA